MLSEILANYTLVKPDKKIRLNIAPRENARISVGRERFVNCKKGNFDYGVKKKTKKKKQAGLDSKKLKVMTFRLFWFWVILNQRSN